MSPTITIDEFGAHNSVADVVLAAFHSATCRLPGEVISMPGMSGRAYRRFINNLMAHLPSYMEIGSWAGSTLCSAIHGNKVTALAIDNWSEFDGPADAFFRNVAASKGEARVSFIERDYRKIDYGSLARCFDPFAVYLYDGPHAPMDQYEGIIKTQPMLAPRHVLIVDDWNHASIREATMTAIHNGGLQMTLSISVRTTGNGTHVSGPVRENSEWHNGVFIAVMEKPAISSV